MRQLTLYKIEESQGDPKASELLQEVYEFFMLIQRPKVFNPYDGRSVLIESDLEHENICNTLEENGFASAKKATVLEFLSKVRFMEKRAQKIKENGTSK